MGIRDNINDGGIVYSPTEISGKPRVERYAKTLYRLTRPKEWEERITALTKGKVPRFFIYAKDKTPSQCESANGSTVNRLFDKVQSYKFDFKKKQLGTFDYKKLMHDPKVITSDKTGKKIIRHYETTVRQIGDRDIGIASDKDRYVEVIKTLRGELAEYGDERYVADVLIKHLFGLKKSIHKAVFWETYGDIVYQNLLDNKAGAQKMCARCGARFTPLYPHHCLCDECAKEIKPIPPEIPEAYCVDCGRLFQPEDLKQTRCHVCQWLADNVMVQAGPGEVIETCVLCGGAFAAREKGRGKRRKVCDRCRDESKRAMIRERVRKHRGQK